MSYLTTSEIEDTNIFPHGICSLIATYAWECSCAEHIKYIASKHNIVRSSIMYDWCYHKNTNVQFSDDGIAYVNVQTCVSAYNEDPTPWLDGECSMPIGRFAMYVFHNYSTKKMLENKIDEFIPQNHTDRQDADNAAKCLASNMWDIISSRCIDDKSDDNVDNVDNVDNAAMSDDSTIIAMT